VCLHMFVGRYGCMFVFFLFCMYVLYVCMFLCMCVFVCMNVVRMYVCVYVTYVCLFVVRIGIKLSMDVGTWSKNSHYFDYMNPMYFPPLFMVYDMYCYHATNETQWVGKCGCIYLFVCVFVS